MELILICSVFYSFRANTNRRISEVYKCTLCKSYHALRFCRKFLDMSTDERNSIVRKYDYCINCLAKSHTFRKCKSGNTCHRCQNYHHTLLHRTTKPRITPPNCQRQTSHPRQKTNNNKKPSPKPSSGKKPQQRKDAPKKPSTTPQARKTHEAQLPNQLILSEAIKSLATVLCATQTITSSSTRRHV